MSIDILNDRTSRRHDDGTIERETRELDHVLRQLDRCDASASSEPASRPLRTAGAASPASPRRVAHRHAAREREPFGWLNVSLLALAVMCITWGLFIYGQRGPVTTVDAKSVATTAAGSLAVPERVAKPIQEVMVGDRVLGTNPLRQQAEEFEPDPATWGKVSLEMRKASGLGLWIDLLRPLEWLEAQDAHVGATIWMDLPEMGAVGYAEVTNVGPCPEIKKGAGTVVTGTFRHEADASNRVVNLRIEGQAEPTGVTENHAYWSADREEFVPVGDLHPGERVDTPSGLRRVVSIEPIDYEGFLYNLETTEHVYRVGTLATLVHNACANNKVYQLVDDEGIPVYYGIADGERNLARRLSRHAKTKQGQFAGQQVLAEGLTRDQARSLETSLIDAANRSGRNILNKRRSIPSPLDPIPTVTDPTVTHLPPGNFSQ